MVLNMGCSIIQPDMVNVAFRMPHFVGCLAGCDGEHGKALAAAFSKGGFDTEFVEDYRSQAYKKAILNASLGSVSALTRMTMSDVMSEPELYRMMAQIVREGIDIGQALGLEVDEAYHDQAMAYLSKGGNHKPSILLDIERCRPTENEYHCGKMFRWAEALNIEAPVTQSIYYLLKNLERSLRKGNMG
jgi:2-dehydropantoate 2-reductase